MQIRSFERSINQLETELITAAERCNASEYELLKLIAEFELRQGFRLWLMNSTAEWLNLKCGITVGTAQEKVRVALALLDEPKWSEAFRTGQLSYSKARAMTRVPDADEDALLDEALHRTASQVETWCRRLRNADPVISTRDAEQAHRSRWLSCTRDAEGMVHLNADLPADVGLLVMKALEIAAQHLPHGECEHHEEADNESFCARQADALVDMAKAYLSGDGEGKRTQGDRYQVVVHVDESALQHQGGKSDLPISTVERLLCDASAVELIEDGQGQPLDVGRKYRTLPPAQRRALEARDGHCQYPGCTHTLWLEGHHVEHWARGGKTSVDASVLMCSRHHRLLHEGGFEMSQDANGSYFIRTLYGRVLTSDPSRDGCRSHPPSRDGLVQEPRALYLVR
jgi:hypothetical protein